jgi:hypothetical protein
MVNPCAFYQMRAVARNQDVNQGRQPNEGLGFSFADPGQTLHNRHHSPREILDPSSETWGHIMLRARSLLPSILFLLAAVTPLRAAEISPPDFQPDPKSVVRYGPAYRYPQDGWIVLHIEGQPYERGYQHGRLLAPEIAAYVRCLATSMSPSAPAEGWKNSRMLINSLWLRRYDKEYLEEMKGIADGATDAGARYDGKPIDLVDVVGLNVWPEIDTLESALEATPTGLEGMRFPHSQPKAMPTPKPEHCSAFAATGPATKDGKIVFGHITMFGLYPSYYYNVWLDVKPTKGHRVIIQSYPGGIQSGLDYYLNDAGILVTETTIAQTKFDINGFSVASRIRQALQYADSIDKAVEILSKANNGLYTNEWLLADIKTNEIAMFELGTDKSKLYRSSKNEWFGDTAGFYWGCNNTKDRAVRLETIPGVKGRPANMCFCPSDRDKMWLRLYDQYKGKMDADFGKIAFTTPPLAAYHSIDAKFTTTDLAKDLKSWALFGPPLGKAWRPTLEESKRFPEIRPLVSNPWTILHANPPGRNHDTGPVALDVPEPINGPVQVAQQQEEHRQRPTKPAWHGTIFPKTDADIWLAAAFAEYEHLVAAENAMRDSDESAGHEKLTPSERDNFAVQLYGYRSAYLTGARTAGADTPLAATHSDLRQDNWYQMAHGKGVLVLNELRHLLGKTALQEAMDSFGRANAGKEVTAADFVTHLEKAAGKPLGDFFDYWLNLTGLPSLRLGNVTVSRSGKGYKVEGDLFREGQYPRSVIELVVETAKGEEIMTVPLEAGRTSFAIETKERSQRLIVDKYGMTAKASGGVYNVLTFHNELEKSLIVYGTGGEKATNREAGEDLQKAIIQAHSNYAVPIKTDKEVTEEDLKTHHLLLIGRPDINAVVKQFAAELPITFGTRSFTVRHDCYAHAGSAVLAAAANPANGRYSIVVIAGLSPEATLHAAPRLMGLAGHASEVVVLPNHAPSRVLVVPPRELEKELGQTGELSTRRSGK